MRLGLMDSLFLFTTGFDFLSVSVLVDPDRSPRPVWVECAGDREGIESIEMDRCSRYGSRRRPGPITITQSRGKTRGNMFYVCIVFFLWLTHGLLNSIQAQAFLFRMIKRPRPMPSAPFTLTNCRRARRLSRRPVHVNVGVNCSHVRDHGSLSHGRPPPAHTY